MWGLARLLLRNYLTRCRLILTLYGERRADHVGLVSSVSYVEIDEVLPGIQSRRRQSKTLAVPSCRPFSLYCSTYCGDTQTQHARPRDVSLTRPVLGGQTGSRSSYPALVTVKRLFGPTVISN
jgi:hypothetical protein